MKQLAFLFVLTALLLGSCAPVTASPTQPVMDTATPTIIPSQTPPPTPSAISTIIPYPPLHTQGPYLLFTRDNKSLTIMDADGSGRKQIQLPNNGHLGYPFEKAVSPDGKWIAFFTGPKEEPYDLALNLFNLQNKTTFFVANLIAPGFPENLEPVTKTAFFTEYDTDCSNDPKCPLNIVASAFIWSIESISWSPDGKSLAFAAQIDGPSSDIYLYDIENKSIRRLTKELQNISSIDWSPNGKKILYTTSEPGTIYISNSLHIADPKSKSLQNSNAIDGGLFWGSEGWITENLYLIWSGGEGAPPQKFRYINAENQQVRNLWKYETEIFALLPELHGMIFVLSQERIDYDQIPMEPGTYFVTAKGNLTKLSEETYIPIRTQNSFADSFFANKDSNLYSIKIGGSSPLLVKESVDFTHSPRISPDKNWVMVEGYDGLQLFSDDFQLIKSWDIHNAEIIWRSDSLGVLLFIKTAMYYLPFPDGEPILIEDCAPDYCSIRNSVWLP